MNPKILRRWRIKALKKARKEDLQFMADLKAGLYSSRKPIAKSKIDREIIKAKSNLLVRGDKWTYLRSMNSRGMYEDLRGINARVIAEGILNRIEGKPKYEHLCLKWA